MPKKPQNHLARGLEMLINDPRTNPFTTDGSKGFKAVLEATNLPMTETLRYLGKKKKKKVPEKKESDISKERLERLETHTEENKK